MGDWASSESCSEFLGTLRAPEPLPVRRRRRAGSAETGSLAELIGVCRGIIADGGVTTEEVVFLSKWLEEAGVMREWPGTEIAETVERIMADGVVTTQERDDLLDVLRRVDKNRRHGQGSVGSSGKVDMVSPRAKEEAPSADSAARR